MALESVLLNDWPVLSALIDEALALPPEARDAWMQSLDASHAVHRDTLRALLATQASVETGDFLDELPSLRGAAPAPAHATPAAGHLIGAYRLIELIGNGGMGTVWLAERADGLVKRRVALKLPHAVWGEVFAERLAREREILASLEHPNIARLYDAGVDAYGRPYLAMAFVAGQPIDTHCREKALTLRARVELLLQVLAAVAHAHSRLVVHRDLKPSNILVGPDGQVALLDFGIAKLLDGERTSETALTALSGRALTLDYASPEQIRGEPLGTASDIYSLAVVAYELLAGGRPYRLKRGSAAELEEAIAGVEAPRASDTAATVLLKRQLRGDVDAILNKALKKRREDRYVTMDGFADDLRRWRDGEPVQARPDTAGYRAAKFVGRHRLQVATGVAVSLALLAGATVATWQAREAHLAAQQARAEAARAKVEAETSNAVQGFIVSVFSANSGDQADPVKARALTARELLDRGAERIDKELASAPEAQRRLYDLLAEMYADMNNLDRCVALTRRSLALATQLHGEDSETALATAASLGRALNASEQPGDALETLQQADQRARARTRDLDRSRLLIDVGLSEVYLRTDLPQALERARRAAATARALGASPEGIVALHGLGLVALRLGHLGEAHAALLEAVAWIDRQPHGASGELPNLLATLGELQSDLGQPGLADASYARALSLAQQLADATSLHRVSYMMARHQLQYGLLRESRGVAAAEYAWARSLAAKHDFGATPARVTLHYGRTLVAYGDAARGLEVIDQARAMFPPRTPSWELPYWAARSAALITLRRLPEARVAVDQAQALLGSKSERKMVEVVSELRRRAEAATGKAEEALQDLLASPPKNDETTTAYVLLRRQSEVATLQLAAGHHAAAQTAAAAALAAIDRLPERRFAGDIEARMTAVLGQALLGNNRAAEALPVLQKALALHLAQYDPVHSPATATVRLALKEAQLRVAH